VFEYFRCSDKPEGKQRLNLTGCGNGGCSISFRNVCSCTMKARFVGNIAKAVISSSFQHEHSMRKDTLKSERGRRALVNLSASR